LDSNDLEVTQEYLSGAYARMRLRTTNARPSARITAQSVGPVSLARINFGFNMDYTVEPTGLVIVGCLHSGSMSRHVVGGHEGSYGPGDVVAFAQPDQPCAGWHSQLCYDLVTIDPSLLTRVATPVADRRPTPVRLLGHRPVSRVAAQNLQVTIASIRDHVLAKPEVRGTPLSIARAAQLLAAAVLTTFPNNAVTDPVPKDRRDANTRTLRRSITFVRSPTVVAMARYRLPG
jgi:hypothetical protein